MTLCGETLYGTGSEVHGKTHKFHQTNGAILFCGTSGIPVEIGKSPSFLAELMHCGIEERPFLFGEKQLHLGTLNGTPSWQSFLCRCR